MKRKLQTLLLMCLTAHACYAQMGKLYDANQQLSSSFTNQVYLDNDGFIWTATRNGLNRYDGYQFRIFKKDPQQEHTMASNYVNCIVQDKRGRFYLGMWGVLQSCIDNQFHTIEVKDTKGNHIDCYITCFLVRKNGDVLAGTSGFGVLQIDDPLHAHQLNGALKDIHTVEQLMEDQQGRLWILGRREGLICYDGHATRTYFSEAPVNEDLRRICQTADGTIYLGTMSRGLLRFDGTQFVQVEQVGRKPIAELYANSRGEVMIGYDGAGLAIYDPKTGRVTDNPYYSMEIDLAKSKVYSIVEDRGGNVWLGLLQKGLFMQPKQITEFEYLGYKLGARNLIGEACVTSTLIDRRGRCWIGTDKDGLYCLDDQQRLLNHFKAGFPGTILSLAEDPAGRIWAGSYSEGFGFIDPDGRSYHPFQQYQNASAFAIKATKSGDLWIATMGQGLLRLNLQSGQLTTYTTKEKAPDDRRVNSLTNNYISGLSLSADEKRLYAATTMGLCCLDIPTGSWVKVFGVNCLNYGTPVRIAKEFGDSVWIGTNDGLYCYGLKQKSMHQFTTEKGLADNGIASIERDKKGRLWIGTDHGLCCYDPKKQLTANFYVDNGLQSNEFSDDASWAVDRGDCIVMIFGGIGGVTWFHPEHIQEMKWDAKVNLVNFIVNRKAVSSSSMSGDYQVCDTTVIAANRFQLAPQENTFTLQFSTLTYDNPEHISYLYSINGEAYTRMQPGANEITFTHLPPGSYRFRVKAEQNNVETAEREFTVIIHSPWYRSAWAYCFYLLIAGLAAWAFIISRRRKMQSQLRLQEHIHAEQLSDAKLRFFMNISHEIRTPMTLIISPLLSLIKNESDPQRKSVYETIRRNAERILDLINQMMDIRKIDKGQMQMRMAETDLISFVREIHDLFTHQARAKRLTLNFEHDCDQLPIWIDRRNFDKVIVNILSNAFKFTPTGGEINIRITHSDSEACIAISDNGEKIPEDKLDKIFERFYQSASSVNDRNIGTGIGLDLTHSLVELHHGTIVARNLEQGCEFVVTLPLGNSHLKPEEMILGEDATEATHLMATETEGTGQQAAEPETAPSAASRRLTIVIAEDDSEIRDYLLGELSHDYTVKTCENGKAALSEVLRTLPDLVISDIMMPEMDGNTLCTKIKANPSTNHIPVILLTAKNRDEDKLEGLETGANAYLVKPFNMDILRRTIINLINTQQLMRLKYGRNDELEEQVKEVKIKSPDQKLLDKVMNSINNHLNDSDLSVDMIADEVGISRVHLHRKMKELTGQTPHDFIRNIRLKQAANLLANQGMNVTEVMYACGFSNSASFSTVFKKFYGMSPRDYMKEHYKQKR